VSETIKKTFLALSAVEETTKKTFIIGKWCQSKQWFGQKVFAKKRQPLRKEESFSFNKVRNL